MTEIKEPQKISVIIPCHNEAGGIAEVIRSFPIADISAQGYSLEIIVIDNNSSDNTAAVAEQCGARVVHESRKGKGNAIRKGFDSVSPDTRYVVMLDGDNTYRPEEILRVVEPLRSGFAKVIIGSRLQGRISQGSMRGFNKFGNHCYSLLVRVGYKTQTSDVLTGYFAWSKDVVDRLRPHLRSEGFAIEMEMITKMAKLGEEIFSVPISYHARIGESKLSAVRDGFGILRMYTQNLFWNPESRSTRRAMSLNGKLFGGTREASV